MTTEEEKRKQMDYQRSIIRDEYDFLDKKILNKANEKRAHIPGREAENIRI